MNRQYNKIKFDEKKTYLIRLHYDVPRLSKGRYGEYFNTYVDVWESKSNDKDDVVRMVDGYHNNSSPIQYLFDLPFAFFHMWQDIGLRKNSLFYLEKFSNLNAVTQERYPYYEIKLMSGDRKNEIHSTLKYRNVKMEDLDAYSQRQKITDPRKDPFCPNELRLVHPNEEVSELFDNCVKEALKIIHKYDEFEKNSKDVLLPQIIFIAKTLYHETNKRGYSQHDFEQRINKKESETKETVQ